MVDGMDEQIVQLLACASAEDCLAFLEGWRGSVAPVELAVALKTECDKYRRNDLTQARHLANLATIVAVWSGDAGATAWANWAQGNACYFADPARSLPFYQQALPFF